MGRRAKETRALDRELADLPPALRWREFMMRVEAVIFAASQPVKRETLAALIGSDCNLDQIIADIREELRSRPYELVEVAGGYQHRTRPRYGYPCVRHRNHRTGSRSFPARTAGAGGRRIFPAGHARGHCRCAR